MVSIDWLKQICLPPGAGKAFYRPFICNGDISKSDIFFVGTNPATPIFPNDMEIGDYVKLLLSYDDFLRYYKVNRANMGKEEVSRTRMGMNSFLSWLSQYTESSVIETEAIPISNRKTKAAKKGTKICIGER
jgi:hypothetical protein